MLLTKYYTGDQIKEIEIYGTCSTHKNIEKYTLNFNRNAWRDETIWRNSLPLSLPSFRPTYELVISKSWDQSAWSWSKMRKKMTRTSRWITNKLYNRYTKIPTSIFKGSLTSLCCSIISESKCFIFQTECGANGRCNQSLVAKPAVFSDSDIFVSLRGSVQVWHATWNRSPADCDNWKLSRLRYKMIFML